MSVHHRLRLLAFPMRTRSATCLWSDVGSPGSRARSLRTCQCLRPRRVVQVLALALLDLLPSATQTASAPGISFLSRLNGWPARSPADASPTSSRIPAHGSGPMWFATPSSWWTRTTYSLPVSRRTCVKTQCRAKPIEWVFIRSRLTSVKFSRAGDFDRREKYHSHRRRGLGVFTQVRRETGKE